MSCQAEPCGERGKLFVLRPRRSKRTPELGNTAHQLIWFGTEHLSSAIQEFLLFDCEILQAIASARMQKGFAEKLPVR